MKMNVVKRLLVLGISTTMILGALTGCGETEKNNEVVQGSASENQSSVGQETKQEEKQKEPVTLEWYYRGNGQQADTEEVEARINELLKDYPGLEHVSINLNCYPSSDYATQVSLAQTSGLQIDILNSVSLDFNRNVRDGSWMPLNDLISDELRAELPEWLWELGSVNGNTYFVPNYQNAFNAAYIFFPKEYMDKYGDYDEMYATLTNWDLNITERVKCLEEYVYAVRKGEETDEKYAMRLDVNDTGSLGYYFITPYDHLNSRFIVKNNGEHKVEYLFTSDEMKELYSIYADWFDKGIISPDGLNTDYTSIAYANMLNDRSTVFTPKEQVGSPEYVSGIYGKAWGMDLVAIPIQEYDYVGNSWGAGGNGVSATCENPEEAIKFIEALTTGTEIGKEIYNTVVFGIEGKHYEKDANDPNRITTLEYEGSQGGGDTSYAAMKWIMGNSFYAYKNQAVIDGQFENIKKYNEAPETQSSDHNGFVIDTSKVSVQLDQINVLYEEFVPTLLMGVAGEGWEELYNEYVKKLEVAGVNEVMAEFQAQLDAWLQANGK